MSRFKAEHVITRQGKPLVLYAGESPEQPDGYCRCGCGEKTRIALRNEYRRGHVKGQPIPFIWGHSGRRLKGPHYRLDYAGYTTPCWLWMHGKTSAGYGQISLGGSNCHVHVLAYESANGRVPEGLELHHLCENRDCINPEHLVPLTHESHARISSYTKLAAWEVKVIRGSDEPTGVLSKKFGVSPQAICDIRKGRRWKGVAA